MENEILKKTVSTWEVNRVQLADLICGANRKIEQSIEANLKPHGVSIEQYRVFMALSSSNAMPMGELAAKVFVDSPTLTKIVDKMVATADVYRGLDPQDRRRVLVFLSDKGRTAFSNLQEIGVAAERKLVGKLGERRSSDLENALLILLAETGPGDGKTSGGTVNLSALGQGTARGL